MENVYILFLSIESLLSFFERDFMRPKCVDGQDEERGGGSSRPFVSTVCGRVDERERERGARGRLVAAWAKRGTDTQQMVSLEGRNPISRTVQREARL